MTTLRRRPSEHTTADASASLYRLNLMTQDDVPEVSRVERRCFANPWPASAYRRELQNPTQNYYVVVREVTGNASNAHFEADDDGAPVANDGASSVRAMPRRALLPINLSRRSESNGAQHAAIIGFAGMWLAFDEAHVTTIGIDPAHRGQGLGELLLLCMFDEAIVRGANWLTLEVRVSNTAAQTLYRKYGFTTHGTRKRYYSDNNEDALIMWSPSLNDAEFRSTLETRRAALQGRLAGRIQDDHLSPFSNLTQGHETP